MYIYILPLSLSRPKRSIVGPRSMKNHRTSPPTPHPCVALPFPEILILAVSH